MADVGRWIRTVAGCAALAVVASACADSGETIAVSGSSTVGPITEAVARGSGFAVDVEQEGTTAGFARFCAGDSAINNASEAIPGPGQAVDYLQQCEDNGVDFVELPIAMDALSVVRHVDNGVVTDLSVDELRRIWAPDSDITSWSDLRSEWPDEPMGLYGRPEGSGTFDYFTHQIVGEAGRIRDDYQASNDMVELTEWLAEDVYSLAFLGAGNYLAADEEVRTALTTVAIDGVEPTLLNAQDGSYQPLTRPLFIYVSTDALESDEVAGFVAHYLDTVRDVLPATYFYRLPDEAYELAAERFEQRSTGSMYEGNPFHSASVVSLLGG